MNELDVIYNNCMSDQKVQEKGELKKTVKTFVRGAFLYSQDGFDYEERGKDIEKKEKVV